MRIGKIIITAALFVSMTAQGAEQVDTTRIMTIDGYPITRSYFEYSFAKNGMGKSKQAYLQEFTDFQLRVREARATGLDTTKDYVEKLKAEMAKLQEPYAMNMAMVDSALRSEEEKSKTNYRIQHIYIAIKGNGSPKDTAEAYKKAMTAARLTETDPFDSVAIWMSEEGSVKRTRGYLPWVSAGALPYPIEKAVYASTKGKVTGPIRTQSAYYLIRIADTRQDPGKRFVRHLVCLKDFEDPKKTERDQAYFQADYERLKKAIRNGRGNEVFDSLYNTPRNVDNGGGDLVITVGNVLPEIENEAVALKKVGDISKMFDSPFGFHILRLDSIAEKNFEADAAFLYEQSQRTGLLRELTRQYANSKAETLGMTEQKRNYDRLVAHCEKQGWDDSLITSRMGTLRGLTLYSMKVNGKTKATTIGDLFDYMREQEVNASRFWMAYEDKKTEDQINMYLSHLQEFSDDFANQSREFSDTEMNYRLMRTRIWDRGEDDKEGMQHYFETHKKNYGDATTTHGIRGRVKADYEDSLEEAMMTELRSKHQVVMNEKAVAELK